MLGFRCLIVLRCKCDFFLLFQFAIESKLDKNSEVIFRKSGQDEAEERKISFAWSGMETKSPETNLKVTNSEDEDQLLAETASNGTADFSHRRVSMISWNTPTNDSQAAETKKRIENRISEIQRKQTHNNKNSILNDVIKSEKRKSQFLNKQTEKLEDDDSTMIRENSEILKVEQGSKCCGLIKRKKKTPVIKPKNSIKVRYSENNIKESKESFR